MRMSVTRIGFVYGSLDQGFRKNLAASEPNEETGRKFRPQIRETHGERRRRSNKRMLPKHALLAIRTYDRVAGRCSPVASN